MDNAAFGDHSFTRAEEVKHILTRYANRIDNGYFEAALRDTNGNQVGQAVVTE
jgi:hypothetical protein